MGAIVIDSVFWVKIGFIVVVFLEAFLSGIFPTYSKGCRESPKILGIANSFASGVFIAIALVHILPEEGEIWGEVNPDSDASLVTDDEADPAPGVFPPPPVPAAGERRPPKVKRDLRADAASVRHLLTHKPKNK